MKKMPPIEKIPEAYSAIIDNRVDLKENIALVKSSDLKKVYTIKWQDNTYYSNDNSTYWQNYPGYPVIAVLMLQNKLSYNEEIATYFKSINWHELNANNKRDYTKSLNDILSNVTEDKINIINSEINKVYQELSNLDLTLTKKQNLL